MTTHSAHIQTAKLVQPLQPTIMVILAPAAPAPALQVQLCRIAPGSTHRHRQAPHSPPTPAHSSNRWLLLLVPPTIAAGSHPCPDSLLLPAPPTATAGRRIPSQTQAAAHSPPRPSSRLHTPSPLVGPTSPQHDIELDTLALRGRTCPPRRTCTRRRRLHSTHPSSRACPPVTLSPPSWAPPPLAMTCDPILLWGCRT